MLNRDWPIFAGVALCVAAAIGCGFYVISGGVAPTIAMAIAVFSLCVAQAIQLTQAARNSMRNEEVHQRLVREHGNVARSQSEAAHHTDFMLTQIAELRIEAKRDSALVASGFADLKKAYSGIAQEMHGLVVQREAPFVQPSIVYAAPQNILPPELPIPVLAKCFRGLNL